MNRAKRLIYVVVMMNSFGHLVAGYQAMAQNLISASKKSCSAFLADYFTPSSDIKYEDLSDIDQRFYQLTNTLFRYDARIKSSKEELEKLQNCLKNIDFNERIKNCGTLTDKMLKEKIDMLEKKIAKLIEDKNKIVPLKLAFKRSLPILIPALLAMGVGLKRNYDYKQVKELVMKGQHTPLTQAEGYVLLGNKWLFRAMQEVGAKDFFVEKMGRVECNFKK